MWYGLTMVFVIEDSARRHYAVDRIDDSAVRHAIRNAVFARYMPEEAAALIIGRPHAQADRHIEVLAGRRGPDMVVFHATELTDKWRDYWMSHR
jgi:hypothetical protein